MDSEGSERGSEMARSAFVAVSVSVERCLERDTVIPCRGWK